MTKYLIRVLGDIDDKNTRIVKCNHIRMSCTHPVKLSWIETREDETVITLDTIFKLQLNTTNSGRKFYTIANVYKYNK